MSINQHIQPERCLADAPMLLDLSSTRLLPDLLGSNVSLLTTSLVVADLDNDCYQEVQTHLQQGQMVIEPATEADMKALLLSVGPPSELSGSDRLLCRLAKRLRLSLLTSCECLNRNAERRGIRSRSFVWVLDRLVNNGVLKPEMAARKLKELQLSSPWLNNNICQQRIENWQAMSRQSEVLIIG
jgi:hypothetical protein